MRSLGFYRDPRILKAQFFDQLPVIGAACLLSALGASLRAGVSESDGPVPNPERALLDIPRQLVDHFGVYDLVIGSCQPLSPRWIRKPGLGVGVQR